MSNGVDKRLSSYRWKKARRGWMNIPLPPKLVDIQFLVDLIEGQQPQLVGSQVTDRPSYCPMCGHSGLSHTYFNATWSGDRGWFCLVDLDDDVHCSCRFGVRRGVPYWEDMSPAISIPEALRWMPDEVVH